MKALLMEEYKKLNYTDFPDPKIEDSHDLLVRIKAVAICGSDVHGFDGSTGRRKPPIVMPRSRRRNSGNRQRCPEFQKRRPNNL